MIFIYSTLDSKMFLTPCKTKQERWQMLKIRPWTYKEEQTCYPTQPPTNSIIWRVCKHFLATEILYLKRKFLWHHHFILSSDMILMNTILKTLQILKVSSNPMRGNWWACHKSWWNSIVRWRFIWGWLRKNPTTTERVRAAEPGNQPKRVLALMETMIRIVLQHKALNQ